MKKIYKDFINEDWKIHKDEDSDNYMLSNTNDDTQMTMMPNDEIDFMRNKISNLENQLDAQVMRNRY